MTELSDSFLGTYSGEGRWRDERGTTHRYLVTMTLERREAGLGLSFHHDFVEEPDVPDVHFDATFETIAPGLLRFALGPMTGRGYQTERSLHYAIPIPGNLVEAGYTLSGNTCRVTGSAEKNADGNFIMWSEDLTRS